MVQTNIKLENVIISKLNTVYQNEHWNNVKNYVTMRIKTKKTSKTFKLFYFVKQIINYVNIKKNFVFGF